MERVNIEGCLKEYISSDPHFLVAANIDVAKVGEALGSLQVSFAIIDPSDVNEELFDYVYQNNLYDINESNILLMLTHECEIQDVQQLLPVLFTFVFTHQEHALCEYILGNRDCSLSVYLDMYEGGIKDNTETIICVVLRQLDADKIADNIDGGKKRAKITEENKQILQALYNSGVISKPVPAADGQTYKTIRYRHKIVNDSLPPALL